MVVSERASEVQQRQRQQSTNERERWCSSAPPLPSSASSKEKSDTNPTQTNIRKPNRIPREACISFDHDEQ